MAQWVNRLRNNIFVNPPPLPSKLAVGQNIRLVASFNQGTASLQPYQCIWFFRVKPIARLILKCKFFWKPYNFLPIPTIKYYCTYDYWINYQNLYKIPCN